MNHYRNFFIQLKINITIPIHRTLFFFFSHDYKSLTLLSPLANNLLLVLKSFLSCTVMTKFLLKRFSHPYAIPLLLNNCFIKPFNYILSFVNKNWFAKFVINTFKFVSKTPRNICLVFFVK